MECRGSAAETQATSTSPGSNFHLRDTFSVLRQRHRLPGDGAVRVEHHPPHAAGPSAVSAGGGHGVEHWERRDHYRESAEHADWIVLRNSIPGFSGTSRPGGGDWTFSQLGRVALGAYAEGAMDRGEGRDPSASARLVAARETGGGCDGRRHWIFRGRR